MVAPYFLSIFQKITALNFLLLGRKKMTYNKFRKFNFI